MFLILYHANFYRELTLERTDNTEHHLLLDADTCRLRRSLRLHLDVIDHKWTLYAAHGYHMLDTVGNSLSSMPLANGSVARIVTAAGERLTLVAVEQGGTLPVSRKYALASLNGLRIGSDAGCELQYSFQELVSKLHAELVRQGRGWVLTDRSTNGVYCNGVKVQGSRALVFGDRIQIFGLLIVYLSSVLCVVSRGGPLTVTDALPEVHDTAAKVSTTPRPIKSAERFVNRSPRVMPELFHENFVIEPVPDTRETPSRSLLLTLGPSLTMALPMLLGSLLAIYGMQSSGSGGSAFMYTGLITAVGSAALGAIWGVLNLRQQKKEEYEAERARVNAYSNYLVSRAEELRGQYIHNAQALEQSYPPVSVLCTYDEGTPQLWSRNPNHEDFLFQRLGSGNLPFQVSIEIPMQKFSLRRDPLQEKPADLKREYAVLQNVPVGVALDKELLIGIVGGPGRAGAVPVVYSLLAGLVTSACYADVKIAVVSADGSSQRWDFVRWLPHVWNEGRTARYCAVGKTEASDVFFELSNVLRSRVRQPGVSAADCPPPRPWYVLFVEDPALLDGELIAKYVYAKDPALGLTTVLLTERREDLPNACEYIIENDDYYTGALHPMQDDAQPIRFDTAELGQLTALAKRLAPLRVRELESGAEIPDRLDFLELYGVHMLDELNVADRWRKSRTYTTMRVPIGVKAGGAPCCLDIHEKFHGPHGLIAGTTGSGKSETLQTYILSLAVNFSPEDVGFFIIDFKGGGMANLFNGLPHLLGQISNLSGNQVRRAMISIKSENRRRQRIFNEYGVNSINQYTRLYKSGESHVPVPHLFIIIDEFAELKREEPDFMRELISVAQVGRSLGVHLILATQKPSGTVDDNIWSNAKFRLCLRVQDRQDSNDMLHKPDAAFITQAGRCYLQVGNDEIYEQFQSGWSGAPYDEHGDTPNAAAILLTRTGKAGIIGSRARSKRRERERLQWLTLLARELLAAPQTDPDAREDAVAAGPLFAEAGLAGNAAARRALHSFCVLWPIGETDPDRAAAQIVAESYRQGVTLPAPAEKTQLDAIVEYLAATARAQRIQAGARLWLPVLPTLLAADALEENDRLFDGAAWPASADTWELEAPVGLLDDPENQLQLPLRVDLANGGHLAVCGSVFSGKSTLLQTLVFELLRRCPPDRLNVYLLDFSSHMLSCFAGAPQVGAVLDESDPAQVGNFICLLESLLDERKHLLKGGNYSQYVRAHGVTLPAVIVVIDNYTAFAEKTEDRYEHTILRAAREGVGYGIFLVLSAAEFGMGGIPNRIAENLKNVLCLNLGDKFKYMELLRTNRIDVLPESGVPGRGLAVSRGIVLEFQSAAAVAATDDYARGEAISALCGRMAAAWHGPRALPVPRIPDQPAFTLLQQEPGYPALRGDPARLALGYRQENAALYSLDLSLGYCYLIAGRERTGKTNTLMLLMQAAADKSAQLAVFEKGAVRLQPLAERLGADYLADDKALFDFWQRLTPEFVRRNKRKKALENAGRTESEIYAEMRGEPLLFFFIADLAAFFGAVYHPAHGVGEMKGFMETILQKGALHNIYFIGACNTEDQAALLAYPAFRSYTARRGGLLLGGNPAGQRCFSFQNIPFQQLSKPLKKGIALVAAAADDTQAETVVIPLAGR